MLVMLLRRDGMQTKWSFPQTMFFGFSAKRMQEHPGPCLGFFGT